MHLCLQIPELVYEIAYELFPTRDVRYQSMDSLVLSPMKGRNDVLALATTCKGFLELSLDILWRDMRSIRPIYSVLCSLSKEERDRKKLSTAEFFAIARWDRLEYYCRRIRSIYSFGMICSEGDEIHSLLIYHQKATGHAVTPNLRSLMWDMDDDEDLQYLPFCGPNLTFLAILPLYLFGKSTSAINGQVMECSLPNLVELEFLPNHWEKPSHQQKLYASLMLIYLHRPLRSINSAYYSMSYEQFDEISAMPDLHSFSLETLPEIIWNPRDGPPPPDAWPFFPALRYLGLHRTRLGEASDFLKHIHNVRHLERLEIKFHEKDEKDEVGRFIATVGESCSIEMKEFHFALSRIGRNVELDRVDAFRVPQSMFSPLLAFKNLEHCDIRVHALDIDDSFVESAASSWPNLVTFVVIPLERHAEEAKLTLLGLLPLAKKCPRLETVWLILNQGITAEELGTGLDKMVRTWDHTAAGHDLPNLELWLGGLTQLMRQRQCDVVVRLIHIFPNLMWCSDPFVEYCVHALRDKTTRPSSKVFDDEQDPYPWIPELVGEIAIKLRAARGPGEYEDIRVENNYRDVLALALTCKGFLEQSLDVLWRDMDSISPINHVVDILPRTGRQPEYMDIDGIKKLGLTEADWARLDYHGPRIRSLKVTGYHPPVYDTLLRYVQETSGLAVTPNLRSLIWDTDRDNHFGFIPFCGPSLAFLTITPPSLDISALYMASRLKSCLSGLEELVFWNNGRDNTTKDRDVYASSVVLCTPPLRSLDSTFHHLSPEAFARVASMPRLETLSLSSLPLEPYISSLSGHPASPFLPVVKNLCLRHFQLDTISRVLTVMGNAKQLERLQIEFPEEERKAAIGNFVATVGKQCSITVLEFSLSLTLGYEGVDRVDSVFRIPNAMFSPLLSFKNMERCDIRVLALDIDDTFLESVATSWPNLRVFIVLSTYDYREESRLTLPGLLPLAKNCPRLYNVMLNLNTRITAEDFSTGLHQMVRTWDHGAAVALPPDLHSWLGGLGSLARGRPREVAEHLKAVFPSIRSTSSAAVEYWIAGAESGEESEMEYIARFGGVQSEYPWVRPEEDDDDYEVPEEMLLFG
ncbi:hypothetical protein EVG20_g9339 [Dentipellis fragilis]|uniref:F-box domain-containing protein n=1 Tax=Dentipellis fragilis TaxID=205917 RepID=A0A4Y9XZ51_9AGAM|nr:hypothetical protein EVG20_g9339 [Dentipellis fragilis]